MVGARCPLLEVSRTARLPPSRLRPEGRNGPVLSHPLPFMLSGNCIGKWQPGMARKSWAWTGQLQRGYRYRSTAGGSAAPGPSASIVTIHHCTADTTSLAALFADVRVAVARHDESWCQSSRGSGSPQTGFKIPLKPLLLFDPAFRDGGRPWKLGTSQPGPGRCP